MMKRYISDKYLDRFLNDFAFLFERIRLEKGELDLRLRDDYFNLYYKGNSLAKVEIKKVPYNITVHKKFTKGYNKFPRSSKSGEDADYIIYPICPNKLHSFFSKSNLGKSYSAIKERNFSEELSFEQTLIADNLNRNIFVIDRQITGGPLGRRRVDLLALRQPPGQENDYQFLIIEIKLGNNPELSKKVGVQLDEYKKIFEKHFNEFKECFERTYIQMKKADVLIAPDFEKINIVRPVDACVGIFGYPGIAKDAIDSLSKECPPGLLYKQFRLEMLSLDELKPKLSI